MFQVSNHPELFNWRLLSLEPVDAVLVRGQIFWSDSCQQTGHSCIGIDAYHMFDRAVLDLRSPTTLQRRSPHPLYLLTLTRSSEHMEKVEGKIKVGGTSLARKAVCTGVGDGTQCMHRRAVHSANDRQFWLWRVPNTPHCDQLGTDIGNRTYNRKPMQINT